ncbi:hypothetical protein RISK_001436 [Rhodopirellula islandica]|uniref:Uncharacterized protein n=1 Tax=Rhodopirellula islandica TaxID=595434 RepID=A0A0J1BI45_RHOIS|nr:hypothetical protein RISK_001436 [Rhodopirellula islandica]
MGEKGATQLENRDPPWASTLAAVAQNTIRVREKITGGVSKPD